MSNNYYPKLVRFGLTLNTVKKYDPHKEHIFGQPPPPPLKVSHALGGGLKPLSEQVSNSSKLGFCKKFTCATPCESVHRNTIVMRT